MYKYSDVSMDPFRDANFATTQFFPYRIYSPWSRIPEKRALVRKRNLSWRVQDFRGNPQLGFGGCETGSAWSTRNSNCLGSCLRQPNRGFALRRRDAFRRRCSSKTRIKTAFGDSVPVSSRWRVTVWLPYDRVICGGRELCSHQNVVQYSAGAPALPLAFARSLFPPGARSSSIATSHITT